MARLRFEVAKKSEDQFGSIGYIWLRIRTNTGNIIGTPQARLGNGAWQNLTVMGADYGINWNSLANNTYDVWYKDGRGERIVMVVQIADYQTSCQNAFNAVIDVAVITVNEGSVSANSPNGSGYQYSFNGSPYSNTSVFTITPGLEAITALRKKGQCPEPMGTSILVKAFTVLEASYTKTDETVFSMHDGTIDVTVSGGSGNYLYQWNDGAPTQDRTGLAPGTYTVIITDTADYTQKTLNITIAQGSNFQASFVKTDPTSPFVEDGTITITPTGGATPPTYSITWSDGTSTSFNRTGLPAGVYVANVKDDVSGAIIVLEIILEAEEIPIGVYLYVPLLNSLKFVVKQEVNNCSVFQTMDNVLFCEESIPDFYRKNYYQKVSKCDVLNVQFRSDFEFHILSMYNYNIGKAFVKSFTVELKEENIGKTEDFAVTIRTHVGNPGQSRVYFNSGLIPAPVGVGEKIELLNNADGINGLYTVAGVLNDVVLGVQYLVITHDYDEPAPTSAATVRMATSTVNFNVYESVLNLGDIANGKYFFVIRAFNSEYNFIEATSEPIELQLEHPNCNAIDYQCFDNAFDMTYTTGYMGRVRVESIYFKRLPGGDRSVSRDSDNTLVKISARKTRKFLFETFQLPPYLHEKLSVIFDHDLIKINGVEVQTEEPYSEPKYITRYPLANSEIKVEQTWFDRNNSDDIGSVNDGGFIIVNGGFLKY